MSAPNRLSPMASYYIRRLVESHRESLLKVEAPSLLETALLEPEVLLTRLKLEPFEHLQRINNLEILARAYQNLAKHQRYPEETREIENQILATFGLETALKNAAQLSEILLEETSPPSVSAKQALEVLQGLLISGKLYLGPKISTEYWILAQPQKDWLESITMSRSYQLGWSGLDNIVLSQQQIEDLRAWAIAYITKCSQIIHGFHEMINLERIKLLSITEQDLSS